MRRAVVVFFLLVLPLFMNMVFFISTTNGLFRIDDYYKTAPPSELVHFDIDLFNNGIDRETILINQVWANSVLWFPMDLVDNLIYDYSSFGNHGTVYGASSTKGYLGNALSFDGVGNSVESTTEYIYDTSLESYTIMAWIKLRSTKGHLWNGIAGIGMENIGLMIDCTDGNQIGAWANGNQGARVTVENLVGEWHFVVAVFTKNDTFVPAKLYLDGQYVGESVIDRSTPASGKGAFAISKTYSLYNTSFDGLIDEVRIFNRALTAQEISWLYNNSWNESLSKYVVELEPGESTQVTFSVKVPEDASVGNIQKFLITAFPSSNPKQVTSQTVTVEVLPNYDLEITLDQDDKRGKQGEILNFQATINNLGNIADTYDIQAVAEGEWGLTLPIESITVPARETGSFNISIRVPFDARPGDYTSFSLKAVSQGNQSLIATVTGKAIATETYRFNITADPKLRQASPGSEATFSLEIKNLGTAPDTVVLAAEDSMGWNIKIEPSSISLEIGETAKTSMQVIVPEDALIGQTNTITINAVSSNDPEASATSLMSVKVVTPFWDLPDVRFIIGISIGILAGSTLITTLFLRRSKTNLKEKWRSQ